MRSKQDQEYIDRLKTKIADYHAREKEQLAYTRKLMRWCVKNGIGYPVPRELGEALTGAVKKYNEKQEVL